MRLSDLESIVLEVWAPHFADWHLEVVTEGLRGGGYVILASRPLAGHHHFISEPIRHHDHAAGTGGWVRAVDDSMRRLHSICSSPFWVLLMLDLPDVTAAEYLGVT